MAGNTMYVTVTTPSPYGCASRPRHHLRSHLEAAWLVVQEVAAEYPEWTDAQVRLRAAVRLGDLIDPDCTQTPTGMLELAADAQQWTPEP